jgi:hypothetical protein
MKSSTILLIAYWMSVLVYLWCLAIGVIVATTSTILILFVMFIIATIASIYSFYGDKT